MPTTEGCNHMGGDQTHPLENIVAAKTAMSELLQAPAGRQRGSVVVCRAGANSKPLLSCNSIAMPFGLCLVFMFPGLESLACSSLIAPRGVAHMACGFPQQSRSRRTDWAVFSEKGKVVVKWLSTFGSGSYLRSPVASHFVCEDSSGFCKNA
jgi:hypothetical protein